MNSPTRADELKLALERDSLEESRRVLIIASVCFPTLYLLFWFVDLIYAPEHRWVFLAARFAVMPVPLLIYLAVRNSKSYSLNQAMGLIYAASCAGVVTFMIYWAEGIASIYYAGLNLIGIIALGFLPFRRRWFMATVAAIYLPFLLGAWIRGGGEDEVRTFLVNCSFASGTVFIAAIWSYTREHLRCSQVRAKLDLEHEIRSREAVIKSKTEEGIKLAALSSQFSPQVVESVKSGRLDLAHGVRRAEICSVFIDIVNSTSRITRLDKENIHHVISMFMEDTLKVLLKFDVTVDKFLGDGVVAFANDPIPHDDYVDRVLYAALEIRDRIQARQEDYETHWLNALDIRVGIATGFADVGFYGKDRLYKSYTAIGAVVNLASRLCAAAEPNQILMSHDAYQRVRARHNFILESLGRRIYKGFEDDVIRTYSVRGTRRSAFADVNELDCPQCDSGIMYLDRNQDHIMVLKCRQCGYVHKDLLSPQTLRKSG
ncbi:MAG: adenylate/guanylate cyclase domain-containing protein [Bdellovibrionales bacterium]